MIGVFTAVCEEDAVWLPQYLQEIDRLGFDFAMHFDRCSDETIAKVLAHPRCIGHTVNKDQEFSERHKQGVLDILIKAGKYDLAVNWDVDETWEKDAKRKFEALETIEFDVADHKWVNLWNDKDHMRVDGSCRQGHRTRIYNLRSELRWRFYSAVINGARGEYKDGTHDEHAATIVKTKLVCLHWGMMTEELRQLHKERWDRIYTLHAGANPYGYWNWALDKSVTPEIQKHDYL